MTSHPVLEMGLTRMTMGMDRDASEGCFPMIDTEMGWLTEIETGIEDNRSKVSAILTTSDATAAVRTQVKTEIEKETILTLEWTEVGIETATGQIQVKKVRTE